MNTEQRNDLAALLMVLRNEGRILLPSLVTLHEELCATQRAALERVCKLEAELAELKARGPEDGGAFELHLRVSVELTPTMRKRIKEMGGKYSECRGNSDRRFVTIPNSAEGRELSAQLLNKSADGVRSSGKRYTAVCILRAEGGLDGHMERSEWTAENLGHELANHNRKGLALMVKDKQRVLDEARGWL